MLIINIGSLYYYLCVCGFGCDCVCGLLPVSAPIQKYSKGIPDLKSCKQALV